MGKKASKTFKKHVLTGTIPGQHGRGPLAVYTDGSVSNQTLGADGWSRIGWATAWGFITTAGDYGCGSYPQYGQSAGNDRAVIAELRGVHYAIHQLPDTQPVILRPNSDYAARVLEDWRAGETRLPGGYTGSQTGTPTLRILQRRVTRLAHQITVETGDRRPLNQGADSLARIALEYGRAKLVKDTAVTQAMVIARNHLELPSARRAAAR